MDANTAPWVNPPFGKCKDTEFPQVGVMGCAGAAFLAGQVVRGSPEVEAHLPTLAVAGAANHDGQFQAPSSFTQSS